VSTAPSDDAFERWRSALLDALKSPENVMAWQDRRYQFAHQIGQLRARTRWHDACHW
jgi:hypothetical protein